MFSSVQSLSHVWLFVTPRITACQAPLSITNSRPEFTQTHAHWVGDATQPSHPLSSPSPPDPNLSQHQGLFQWVSSSHEVAKVSASSISPSSEHPGLISFRMDWLDLLAVQGTFKSLLQHHSSKASILQPTCYLTSRTCGCILECVAASNWLSRFLNAYSPIVFLSHGGSATNIS